MLGSVTRVLLTGADGYIGVRMADHLIRAGFDVVGLDSGFHRVGWLYHSADLRPAMLTKDIRDVEQWTTSPGSTPWSTSPRSRTIRSASSAEDVTYHINHHGTAASPSWPSRRASRASCTCRRAACTARQATPRARRAIRPSRSRRTRRCKVLVEQDVSALADDDFSPTFLRNATAYGASPRQRFDLVVNDLARRRSCTTRSGCRATARRGGRSSTSSTSPARCSCVLDAPRDLVHGEIFNVGSDDARTTRSARSPRSSAASCRDARCSFGDSSDDKRNYRTDFDKIEHHAARLRLRVGRRARVARAARRVRADRASTSRCTASAATPGSHQIRHLLDTGQIDDEFFWTEQA